MKDVLLLLSLIPVIVPIVLLGYFSVNKKINLIILILVGIVMFFGIGFAIFMKYFSTEQGSVVYQILLQVQLVLSPQFIPVISSAVKFSKFSAGNILPNIKSFNFHPVALILVVEIISLLFWQQML